MFQDLTGGNPIVVIAVFVAVVWILLQASSRRKGWRRKDNDDHGV
jgi:hypothetical protein